ncbi:MAG: hypothetical protein IJS78_07050 [Clostridia bacterium]|nr:hypothetical protein [Clostridia bacterium]
MKRPIALFTAIVMISGLFCSCARIKGSDLKYYNEFLEHAKSRRDYYFDVVQFLPEFPQENTDDMKMLFAEVDVDEMRGDYAVAARIGFTPEKFDGELDRLRRFSEYSDYDDGTEDGDYIFWFATYDESVADFMYAKRFDDCSIFYACSRSERPEEVRKMIPDDCWYPLLDHFSDDSDRIDASSYKLLLHACLEKDADALRAMFSKKSVSSEGFEENLERLIEYAGGEDYHYSSVDFIELPVEEKDGKRILSYSVRFGRWQNKVIDVCLTDDTNDPDDSGIYAITVGDYNHEKRLGDFWKTDDETGALLPKSRGIIFIYDRPYKTAIET